MALLEIPSRRSFRRQIILTFVVGFFLLIAAFAAFLISTERDNLHRDSVNETTSMAQSLAASALPWVLADDVAGLQEVVHAFQAYPEFKAAMVMSPEGRVLAHSDPAQVGRFLNDERSQALLKSAHATRVMEDSTLLMDVAVPIELGNRQVGWARVESTKLENAANLHRMIVDSLVFLLVSTILSFIAAMLIANRLGQRIEALVQVAEGVQAGNFAMRASRTGREDEVARLGNSLNKMLDTLSQNALDLRKASLYTRSLIEASVDPLVTISAEGKITDVNEATEKVTGRRRTELVGTDFSNYFTEPDKARAGYLEVFAKGSVTDYPLALRHRDGKITDVLYNASVYRDGAGKVLGVFAAARDVTERNKAEAAMRESEALLHAIMDILPLGLWILDAGGKISFGNDAAKKIWAGVRYVDLDQLGEYKGWRVDTGKPVGSHEWAGARAVEKGETTIGEEIEIECFDGTRKIILDSAVPLRNPDGSIRCAVTINQDITERKRAEMALQQSEEVLKEAQRIAHLGSWHMDVATNEVVWSEELYRIYGFDPALPPPLYTESMKLFTPDSWERLSAAIARAREAGIPYELELETVAKDGGRGWMWTRGEPVHDARGKVVRVRGVVMNITERKKLETQHRQSFAYTRSLIEASLDPLVTISAEGKITDVNQATEKATGRNRLELVGTDFADYFTEPDKARAGYQQVFANGFVTDYPLALRHLDGHVTEVLYNASVYRDEAGNVLGVFAAARDITERKHAEIALREKEERLALSTFINGVGIWDWNLRTQEMIWDDSMYALYHIRREDFIGTEEAWRKYLHPDDLARGDREVADAIAGIKPFDTEFRVVWPNGEIHHIKAVARVFRDENGTPVRMLGTNLDITERKHAEEEVRQLNAELEQRVAERTAQLETANKELEAFSYSVSHDLRSPLRAIDGFSHILLEDYAATLDDEGKRLLNVVRENTVKMGQLIDDILKFSRAGRLGMTMSEIDMESLACEVYEDLRMSVTGRELQVEIGQLPPARGDRAMMRQVLVNLLSNAIKFTRTREPARIKVGARTEGGETIYFVQDNGAGFDMRYVDRLFGVFQRLHAESEFEGTGIGLAIVKRIVARHGGRVWAEGKLNEGATIYFALPAAEAASGGVPC